MASLLPPLHEDDPGVPALQLLLSEASPAGKRVLIRNAFPEDVVVFTNQSADVFLLETKRLSHLMKQVRDDCNGESPLGAHAQNRIRVDIDQVERFLTRLSAIIHYRKG